MLRIKRLYTFIYQTFLPVFAMTFGICLFIFIIQFLWQHIEKLVGKGLETSVLLELFFYATLNLIPMVLPLAILLASLMTFGNMGERLELLAIKASGVSLLRIMMPLIILVTAISIGCFFFQNELAPKFKVKVASLFFSIKQKSPELSIPEGSFYNELGGYSIYVKKKDLETHVLRGVIIYDTSSGGFKNMTVDVCDSAIMKVADSKDYITITMFDGERFANIKDQPGKVKTSTGTAEFTPYMVENFKRKEVIIPFNDDFQRIDETRYDDTQISKNLSQLQSSVDSMRLRIDSLNKVDRKTIAGQPFLSHRKHIPVVQKDTMGAKEEAPLPLMIPPTTNRALDIDSVFKSYALHQKSSIMNSALAQSKSAAGNHLAYFHMDTPKPRLQHDTRMHEIFWHKMFTLPFACFIFFFIGAPLGSIIRKGGLGVPVIISVLLFIIYYIIDNIGYKMARDGVWEVWQGMWLSAGVLFPLGVFLTYKSMTESDLFNTELYGRLMRQYLKIQSNPNRNVTKEPSLSAVLPLKSIGVEPDLETTFLEFDNKTLKDVVNNYKDYGYSVKEVQAALAILKERGTYFFDVRVNNYDYSYSKKLLEYFKHNSLFLAIPLFCLSLVLFILSELLVNESLFFSLSMVSLVGYVLSYIRSYIYMSDFNRSINKKEIKIKESARDVLLFVFYPIYYFPLLKDMEKELEKIKGLHL